MFPSTLMTFWVCSMIIQLVKLKCLPQHWSLVEFVTWLLSSWHCDVSYNTDVFLSLWHDHAARCIEMSSATLTPRWVRDMTIEFITLWCLLQDWCLFEFVAWSFSSLHWDVFRNTHDSLSSWYHHRARYIEVTPSYWRLMTRWVRDMITQLHWDDPHNTDDSLSSWYDHSARHIGMTPTTLEAEDLLSSWH